MSIYNNQQKNIRKRLKNLSQSKTYSKKMQLIPKKDKQNIQKNVQIIETKHK